MCTTNALVYVLFVPNKLKSVKNRFRPLPQVDLHLQNSKKIARIAEHSIKMIKQLLFQRIWISLSNFRFKERMLCPKVRKLMITFNKSWLKPKQPVKHKKKLDSKLLKPRKKQKNSLMMLKRRSTDGSDFLQSRLSGNYSTTTRKNTIMTSDLRGSLAYDNFHLR